MRKVMTALTMSALLALPLASAHADSTPAPQAPSAQPSTMEQYKIDFAAYQEAMRAREAQVRAAFAAFNATVNKAKSDYQTALAAAKGADAKYQAKIAYKNAIQSAADVYDSAITALGPAPVPPMKPAKVAKQPLMQPNNPMNKKGKN